MNDAERGKALMHADDFRRLAALYREKAAESKTKGFKRLWLTFADRYERQARDELQRAETARSA